MKLMELYQDQIMGAIKGLDRIRFRGTLRWLANELGIRKFVSGFDLLLKDFNWWAKEITAGLRQSCADRAEALGIETIYLNRANIDKEQKARVIAAQNGITSGPICNFSVLETCVAPKVKGDKATRQIELKMTPTKCIWLYHYFDHPEYGFGHIRLQSWIPFNVFICLNGRHWLERQLQKQGIDYIKDGNCFPWLEDINRAQQLMDRQLQTNWPKMLDGLIWGMCPDLGRLLPLRPDYYWSANETEWATDIMFDSTEALERLYPSLIYHAMQTSTRA